MKIAIQNGRELVYIRRDVSQATTVYLPFIALLN
mgnify:CR=1 FL=1